MSDIQMKPTKAIAVKLLKTVDAGLCSGLGQRRAGEMCIEAAVCFAFDLPHGDNPPCVGSVVRGFKIALNDCPWSSNAARAKGMRRLALAQLGSDELDQNEFSKLLALRTIQKLCPVLFRDYAKLVSNQAHKKEMEDGATKCESATDLKSGLEILAALAARAAGADLAALAAGADLAALAALAARAALADLAALAALADLAALAALADLAALAALADLAALASDEVLILAAEICLQVLVEMKSPGCKWLGLAESEVT